MSQPQIFGKSAQVPVQAPIRRNPRPIEASAAPTPAPVFDPNNPVRSVRADQIKQETSQSPARNASSQPQSALDELLKWIFSTDGASDLHLVADQVPRARVDGEMINIPGAAVLSSDEIAGMMQVVAGAKWSEFMETGDVDAAYQLGRDTARFRVNINRARGKVGAVMRIIPTRVKTAEELGVPARITQVTNLKRGLVLVCGPTGSGKSTLLAAMVDIINKTRDETIVTIEDPIEFVHTPQRCTIIQREVKADTKTFQTGLKAVLRQDPDVILLGEIRDYETAEIALQAAESGHLVFATMHTKSAGDTVSRYVNIFPDETRNQVAATLGSALQAVIIQILAPKIGGGRVPAQEVLHVTPAIRAIIDSGAMKQIDNELTLKEGKEGDDTGMISLSSSLAQLAKAGTIDPIVGQELAPDPYTYAEKLGRK